jgi:DNA-binding response OmpR family regulator
MPHTPDVVAVINTSADTIDLLRNALQQAGFTVVSAFVNDVRDGRLDLESFMRQHDPAAILWDIALPYDRQWQFFQHIKDRQACGRCQFVITTPNAAEVHKVAGNDHQVYEIVGKPYDLDQVIRAVKEAVRSRPIR